MVARIQVLLLLVFIKVALSRSWASSELPSPQKDPAACGRGSVKSAICDPDGYISQSEADTIDGLINFINEGSHGFSKVPCKGTEKGAQIAVAVIESMGTGLLSKTHRAFQFAKGLHDRWGVGDSECQNGIVLFFAIKDHAMGISTGAGVKSIFKDSMVPNVMAVMRSKLRKEEYGQGIADGVTAIGNILTTGKGPQVENNDTGFFFGVFAIILGGVGLSSILKRRKKRRYAQCKKLLERIDKDRAAANNNEYVATSCPICLEDFQHISGPEELASSQLQLETGNVRIVQTGDPKSAVDINTNTTRTESGNNATKTLPCGHKFHESCILSWISGSGASNQLCPVCRQPITAEGAEHVSDMTNTGQPSGWDVYDPEYSFRLRRARYFYSDFITWNMIDTWESERYFHSHPMATSCMFTGVDPIVVAAAARSSGGGGSSFSFGGGSSIGGGGGGGGW